MRQLFRMYRMSKIIETSMEQKDESNKGKDLVTLIKYGFQPDIPAVKLAFQVKHNYSETVARTTYADLVDNKMVLQHDKSIPIKGRQPIKLKHYVELNTKGRKLVDRFIIPWGLIKAYTVEYGMVATTFISIGLGVFFSAVGRFVWGIIKGNI